MIATSSTLTPEERRADGAAALSAGAGAVVMQLVTWAFEEVKRALAVRREKTKPPPP